MSGPFELHVCPLPPHDPRRLRELARAAEEAGFDRYWVADQTFHLDPFVALGDLAAHTTIPLGLAVTNPYVRHPVQLARAMTTLAHLHPDRRWIFGLGTGNPQHVLAPLGVRLVRGPQHVRTAIDVIRSLARGETASSIEPKLTFQLHEVRLEIEPPPAFDLYVGTRGPRMLEVAGAVADGVLVEAQLTPEGIAWARSHLDAGSLRVDRGRYDRPYVAWQTVELLRENAKPSPHSIDFAAVLIAATPAETLEAMDVPVELADRLRAGRLSPVDIPREHVVKFVAAGTARELVRLVTQARAAGADAWSAVLTGSTDDNIEAIQAFGSQLIAPTRDQKPAPASRAGDEWSRASGTRSPT